MQLRRAKGAPPQAAGASGAYNSGAVAQTANGNKYAAANGNVYKNTGSGWSQTQGNSSNYSQKSTSSYSGQKSTSSYSARLQVAASIGEGRTRAAGLRPSAAEAEAVGNPERTVRVVRRVVVVAEDGVAAADEVNCAVANERQLS